MFLKEEIKALCGAVEKLAPFVVYNTSARAHSEAIYADTVEHARLFKSISGVQRYSLQRSMRASIRSAPCARFMIMRVKRQAVHVRA